MLAGHCLNPILLVSNMAFHFAAQTLHKIYIIIVLLVVVVHIFLSSESELLDESAMSSSADIEAICGGISKFDSAVSILPFEGDVKGFSDGAAPSPQSFIMQT